MTPSPASHATPYPPRSAPSFGAGADSPVTPESPDASAPLSADARAAEAVEAAVASEPATLQSLHARLADAAAERDLLDVAYTIAGTALGTLLLATTPVGLIRVAFLDAAGDDVAPQNRDAVLEEIAAHRGPRLLHAPARLDAARRQIDDYLAGRRTRFDLPVDLSGARGFRGEVQALLPTIPYGSTQSYTELAAHAGRPRAARAVGTACATNPLPLIIPCHRVLRADGSLGGYIGGLAAKRALLDLEGQHA